MKFYRNLIYFFIGIVLFINLSACTGYYIIPDRLELPRENKNPPFAEIEKLYIESFTGRDAARLLPILIDELNKRDVYEIIDTLPDTDQKNVGVVRIEVKEVIYIEDKIMLNQPDKKETNFQEGDVITIDLAEIPDAIRKNCAVSIEFVIRRLSDNAILFSENIGRNFQQVYHNPISIADRPDAEFETDRLSRLIFSSFAEKIDIVTDNVLIAFEKGVAYDAELRADVLLSGNAVIVKGLRYMDGQIWNMAILSWLAAAYEPPKHDNQLNYLANRASAFFNIGQVYRLNKAWDKAAEMFAEANLSHPQLHYAQFWSDMVMLQKINKEKLAPNETDRLLYYTLKRKMGKKDEELYDLQSPEKSAKLSLINRQFILNKKYLYDQISNI